MPVSKLPNAHAVARRLTDHAWPVVATAIALLAIFALDPMRPSCLSPLAAQAAQPPAAEAIIAYGGYSAVAPENTLAAIHAAAAAGVPRLWLDVRTSSDGQLVLVRDATLDRTTDCSGLVSEQPVGNILRCDAGAWFDPRFAGETVPRLADALALPDLRFVLELQDAVSPAVLDAVRVAGAVDRVTLVSASEAVLADLNASAPEIPAWLRTVALTPDLAATLAALGAEGVAVDPDGAAVEEALALTAAGYAVAAVDAADEAQWFKLLDAGLRDIATARVEPMLWALGYQFRRYPATAFGTASLADQAFARTLAIGDFNADGRDDLVVGAPYDASQAPGGGWVGVSLGGGTFPGRVVAEARSEQGGQWGSVFGIGDFGASGFDDLAIGYPLGDFVGVDSGVIWLWEGTAAGIGQSKRPIGPDLQPGAQSGAALAAVDFDGDGVTDLAVGAPTRVISGQIGAGLVTIMPGVAGSGPVNVGALVISRVREDVAGDPTAREGLGSALAGGDFDGDGFSDIAIGVPMADAPGVRDAGSVIVVYGGEAEDDGSFETDRVEEWTRADPAIPGEAERDGGFGAVLAVADFDGDGRDDLVIGCPGATAAGRKGAGDVVVLYGGSTGFDLPRAVAIDQDSALVPGEAEARDAFGSALAAGDLNGDGRPDLVVTALHEAIEPLTDVGTLAIIYADERGLSPRVALGFAPGLPPLGIDPAVRLAFGQALAVGDLNGDRVADLAIGVPALDLPGASQAGALLVAWGYHPDLPGVPTATPPPATITPTPSATRPITPTRSPTPSRTPTRTVTPPPSATPRPPQPAYLPCVLRLRAFPDRWPTPGP
jgi:glycerophosphoryl diester phosphodiesterase